jgi:NADH-quinone oxidoreductase subunit F
MARETPLTVNIMPGRQPLNIEQYEAAGGYQTLRKTLTLSPEQVLQMVTDSNLRGRGGAGFPTGQKWKFVPRGPAAPHPKYLCINADEMEPGTFKDRFLMESDPNSLVENAIISAYAIEADVVYVFVRWAYKLAEARIQQAIADAYGRGYLGKNILKSQFSLEMHVHVSSGRYLCGEEGALLNALEGKRPLPRTKPPFPQACGLWGMPTVVNNVETICNVRHIVEKGPDWFKSLSLAADGGTKIYGASGRVKRPGLWELPMGTPIREILYEHAGGMLDGYAFRGLLPGGGSTDFVIEEHLDTPMDFSSMGQAGSRLGTGTMIVLDDKTCPVGMVKSLEDFFARESCGWCTPCLEGLPWIAKIITAIENGDGKPADLEILREHTWLLGMGNTFCAHAPGAVEPLQSALKYFENDFKRHIDEHRCPWRA